MGGRGGTGSAFVFFPVSLRMKLAKPDDLGVGGCGGTDAFPRPFTGCSGSGGIEARGLGEEINSGRVDEPGFRYIDGMEGTGGSSGGRSGTRLESL